MSRGVNKVILIGNLGNEPEIRSTAAGALIATLSIATSESWRDRNTGQQQEKTEWHRVVIFGKLAEIAQQYLHKGSKVYLEGKLQTRKWQGQDGQDRYTTEIVIDGFNGQLQMLDSAGSSSTATEFTPNSFSNNAGHFTTQPSQNHSTSQNHAPTDNRSGSTPYTSGNEFSDDFEIPF